MATTEEAVEETEAAFLEGEMDDATVEAVEGETPPDEPEEVEETETTDGPARDEQGRFAKKAEGETPSETVAEVPQPEATPEAEVVPPAPFTVRVNKQEFTLEGAEYRPGEGLYVADSQVDFVKNLLQEGAYYKANWRNLEQQAIQKGRDEAVASHPDIQTSKAIMAQIDKVLESEESFLEFFQNFHANKGVLMEKAKREIAEKELERYRTQGREVEDIQNRERIEQEKHATLSETMTELKSVPDLKVFTDDDWRTLDRQVARLNQTGALFVEQEDGTYLNVPLIEEIAKDILQYRKQVVETAKKAEEAAKFNAQNKPKVPGKVPVTTPRKGSAPRKPQSSELDAKAIKEKFLAGELDDED